MRGWKKAPIQQKERKRTWPHRTSVVGTSSANLSIFLLTVKREADEQKPRAVDSLILPKILIWLISYSQWELTELIFLRSEVLNFLHLFAPWEQRDLIEGISGCLILLSLSVLRSVAMFVAFLLECWVEIIGLALSRSSVWICCLRFIVLRACVLGDLVSSVFLLLD